MLHQLTLKEAIDGIKAKKFSSTDLTKATLDRVKALNPKLNAYVTVTDELALSEAAKIDQKVKKGEEIGALGGVPAALKDIFNTKGVRTTCCSKIIENFVPPYDSSVVEMLNKAGMVLTGKLNLDQFACGASTETSYFGVTNNPWDLERVAGGSSGGSAAAVAADLSYYSLGTDTGGSIRQPAALCGIVGLKVTYGRVSRSGVTAMASSWDTIGPMTKTVEDAALIMNVIAGKDPRDATTPDVAVPDYTKSLGKSVKGLKIGVPKEYFEEGLEDESREIIMAAIKEYEKMGATVKQVSLPYTKYGVAVYYVAMPAELSTNLARFDGIRFGSKPKAKVENIIDYYYQSRGEGFGDEIKRRIMVGTYVLSAGYYDAYYKKAQQVRTLIIKDFEDAFKDVDVLMAPVSPFPAFKIGEKANDPIAMYLADAYTIPVSCAGVPAISIPCGFTSGKASGGKKLPVGLQIIAPQFGEETLFKVASAYENLTQWYKQKPVL